MRSAGTSKRRKTFIEGCQSTLAVVAPGGSTRSVAAPQSLAAQVGCCALLSLVADNASTIRARAIRRSSRMLPPGVAFTRDQCESGKLSVQSRPMWKILVALVALAVGAIALWVNAGRAEGPAIEFGGS